ncbi:hypothetical protein EV356DRAFT_496542 [Viridothelium virens]|uniref:Uncharacterized protein n=1 Tax=Viridothelium virens TaxID=1048519 RepID=A0A6A6GU01_VIRVR|nr:hypothetical protein EV356DRAFT_496542 [Viridothelium virens]
MAHHASTAFSTSSWTCLNLISHVRSSGEVSALLERSRSSFDTLIDKTSESFSSFSISKIDFRSLSRDQIPPLSHFDTSSWKIVAALGQLSGPMASIYARRPVVAKKRSMIVKTSNAYLRVRGPASLSPASAAPLRPDIHSHMRNTH